MWKSYQPNGFGLVYFLTHAALDVREHFFRMIRDITCSIHPLDTLDIVLGAILF